MSREELEKRSLKLSRELSRAVEVHEEVGAKQITLAGSLVEGETVLFSDVDLIVVMRTEKRFLDSLKDVYGRIRPWVAMDIMVYAQGELEGMGETSPFMRHALSGGKVLYAA